ncbi:MAG: alanine dehydrogenase [Acidobacteria bacterium]|nr:alanine dehydrogenase [Acidobacteriota bacterium]
MRIGIPKETLRHEHRVGLTPFGVSRLTSVGHQVFVGRDAGQDSHFSDADYVAAGATIVHDADEVYGRSELVCRVGSPAPDELAILPPGCTVCGFLHLAVAPRDVVRRMIDGRLTMIGYELIEDGSGERPVLTPFSIIAGEMAIHIAASLLECRSGGRGLILGGVPGVPPATVTILGAGTVGRTAARHALASGAHVIVLDADLSKLRAVLESTEHRAVTALATPRNLERFTSISDVVIGAVLIPGARAPYLVTEDMVREMKMGAVIVDLSIDQGGCVETSRPTSADNPTFRVHGVTHYCVPNMTASAPRSASRALTIAATPYLARIAEEGLDAALDAGDGLASGLYMREGRLVNQATAAALGLE